MLKKYSLGDLANCQTGPFGSQLHEKDYVSVGIPIVTVEHLGDIEFSHKNLPLISDSDKKRLNKYVLEQGDIVFSRVGSVDRCTYVTEEESGWLFSGRCIRVRCNLQVSARYLSFYFRLNSFKKMMRDIAVGATMPSLNTTIMNEVPLYLPELSNQNKIANLLNSIDSKIKINNRINTELESMAKTLYDYWFVQFDFPDKNGKPYKSSGGKMVYNAILKRKIPEGWEVNLLSHWILNDKTGDWGKDSQEGNYTFEVDCIRGADINGLNGNGNVNAPHRYILEKNSHKLLNSYDFIIEISGGSPTQSTGRMAFITEETLSRFNYPLICSNFCKAIALSSNVYSYNFLYMWNTIYDNGVLFGWEGKTSGIKNLLFDSFINKYQVPLPPKEIVIKFFNFAESIYKQKQTRLKENKELENLRDFLLPMLMNGQVTIKES